MLINFKLEVNGEIYNSTVSYFFNQTLTYQS